MHVIWVLFYIDIQTKSVHVIDRKEVSTLVCYSPEVTSEWFMNGGVSPTEVKVIKGEEVWIM